MIFADDKSRALLEQLRRVAPTDATVFLSGESGTGKEVVARHLHEHSRRAGPFVAVNCGALSPTLAEAELFGYQAGAFTGATETRKGWFEAADRGTLLLDEVSEMSLSLQAKLLRVLQEREVVRLGSRESIPLDVRLVCATNANLQSAVSAGQFRLDLYYRLNVVALKLAPLRERRGDILPLFEHFLRLYAQRRGVAAPSVSHEVRDALLHYAWPGNIRELENVAHAAVIVAPTLVLQRCDLRFSMLQLPGLGQGSALAPRDIIATQLDRLFLEPPADLYRQLDGLIIRRAFEFCGGNQVQTARLLGVSRNVLRTQLKHLGLIDRESLALGSNEQS
jgi:sigma-54 dependent transcriptional regulator